MRRTILLAVACLALQAPPAVAADFSPIPAAWWTGRWYMETRIGFPVPQAYDIRIAGLGSGNYRPESGFQIASAVGVEFTRNWRFEVELNRTYAAGGRAFGLEHAGKLEVYGLLANVLYSFDFGISVARPFVGVGAGLAHYRMRRLGAIGGAFVLNDRDTTFGFALHAGADIPLVDNAAFTARYSLYSIGDATFASRPAGFTTTKQSNVDHVFTVGFRFYR